VAAYGPKALQLTGEVGDGFILQLGDPDIPASGPCAGRTLWHSVVTTTFDSDTKANAWCDAHGLPVRECLARYVPKPGETAKTTERH